MPVWWSRLGAHSALRLINALEVTGEAQPTSRLSREHGWVPRDGDAAGVPSYPGRLVQGGGGGGWKEIVV